MTLGHDHRIVTVAEIVRGNDVLDVGAGECLLEPRVAGSYTGVDITSEVLAAGDRRAVAGATSLPFRDGAFDAVTCVSVLQYVTDVRAALTEFRRVVRPGGQLLILVPNVAFVRHRLHQLLGGLVWSSPLDDWSGGTVRYFATKDFQPLLASLDLRVRAVRCSGRARGLRSVRPQLLGADLIFDLETAR